MRTALVLALLSALVALLLIPASSWIFRSGGQRFFTLDVGRRIR